MNTTVVNEGWEMNHLYISREHNWNVKPGDLPKYTGKITFQNKKEESMSFQVPPEKMQQLLELISDNIIASARELGQGLVQSIQRALLPPAATENNLLE